MTGRFEGRPERQNEYFIPGDGISREVIQADICRYLGNDALVRPGTHNGRPGYLIRAYRNLTSEMIADLKADSARWEADVSRRMNLGHPRAPYGTPAMQEPGQQGGPSPPTYSAAPAQPPYMDPYAPPAPYAPAQNPYPGPAYPPTGSPYGSTPGAYPPSQSPYSGQSQPPVSAPDVHSTYTYVPSTGYGYEPRGNNAPRYTGTGYDDPEYTPPVTSGIAYPATAAPDPRTGMDPRYAEAAYADRNRPQHAREREAPRRPR
ncbi:hypothetical protein VTN02DRAFT_5752 [Thermoascus thermophilus]